MTERLRVSDILVPPDRLRKLDEHKAQLIAVSVGQHGIFQPLAVYRSPAAARPYTLIFGLHRHRAAQIAGLDDVPVALRTKAEATALEIAENLFRNDLTTMERADFVSAWFDANGISQGKRRLLPTLAEVFPDRNVSERAAEDLGFSGRKAQRLRQIAKNLHPELKELFRGTDIANNQVLLLKCARHGPDTQIRLSAAMREGASIETALSFAKPPKSKDDAIARAMKRIAADWKVLPPESRAIMAKKLGLDMRD